MTITSALSDPIADLWREARSWLAVAMHDLRGPAEVARALAREARAAIGRRLALIESLLMKLLLIEAARQSSPACGGGPELPRQREEAEGDVITRPSVSRCALDSSPHSGEHTPHRSEDPTRPETWRVRFRLRLARDARRDTPAHPARLTLPPRAEFARAQRKARRLARRFEALRRVIADPRRAIAALARKLAALGRAAYAAARRIALHVPRRCASLGERHAAAMVLAHDSCAAFSRDTS